jgi:hypothetical protein
MSLTCGDRALRGTPCGRHRCEQRGDLTSFFGAASGIGERGLRVGDGRQVGSLSSHSDHRGCEFGKRPGYGEKIGHGPIFFSGLVSFP